MRVKQVWDVFPSPSKLQTAYSRITLTRWTTSFFLLALLHCITQIILHFQGHVHNYHVVESFEEITLNPAFITHPFALLKPNGDLDICIGIPPAAGGTGPCMTLNFDGQQQKVVPRQRAVKKRAFEFFITPYFNQDGTMRQIDVSGLNGDPTPRTLTPQCIQTLPWAYTGLHNTGREDLVYVVYHIWLLGISVVAILSESLPHIAAGLASEFLAAIWSAYRFSRTQQFHDDFDWIVTESSCNGIDLLQGYFGPRKSIEIAAVVLNFVALAAFCVCSWKLWKFYGERTFNRFGARPDMDRIYKVALTMLTVIQLAAFFITAAGGLFIDQLFLGFFSKVADHEDVYRGIFIVTLILIIPWLFVGWFSIRRESRLWMVVFLLVTLLFLCVWSAMFASDIYRFMFMTCNFFAVMTIFSALLLFATLALGIYSILHFGLGLPEYLRSESTSPADRIRWTLATGVPMDLEKDVTLFTQMDARSISGMDEKAPLPPTKDQPQVPPVAITRKPVPSMPPTALQRERSLEATIAALEGRNSPTKGGRGSPTKGGGTGVGLTFVEPKKSKPDRAQLVASRASSTLEGHMNDPDALSPAPNKLGPPGLRMMSVWSDTTANSDEPSTPATATAVSVTPEPFSSLKRGEKPRAMMTMSTWSQSTSATTATESSTTSSASGKSNTIFIASSAEPVPSLPTSALPKGTPRPQE